MKTVLCLSAGILTIALAAACATLPGCTLSPATADTGAHDDRADDTTGALPAPGEGASETGGASDGTTSADGTDTTTPAEPADSGSGDTTDASDNGGTQSGTLTAGSFDDNLNLDVFRDFLSGLLQADTAGEFPSLSLGRRILVSVKDEQGVPVGDARVVITAEGADTALLDQTTGTDGRVLFLTSLDGGSDATTFTLTVHPPNGADPVAETPDPNSTAWDVTLTTAGALPTKLDLAFVIDATGSMGDELEYVKTEVRSIAHAVSELFPDVQQRYALIVYRDEGDVYVVRPFDFTATLDEFVNNLDAQRADGGGDRPEAVHLALEAAAELSWTMTDTARVLFHIADAPPHAQFGQRTLDAVAALRAKTIAIYPVAASGVESDLEFYMRTEAFLTLSQYLFLTDDSRVGHSHAEPHIPCYQVQRLDQLMIRMIRTELTGTRVEADPADILRTVGNPVNGVCTEAAVEGQ